MSLIINHNLMAQNAARHLNESYSSLGKSVQRLSSGKRVNSSADDAAGLAIRELMRAEVKGLNQGIRNANDAISLIQTADGSLGIIDEKLIRMKELAEQAATGTYSSDQRLMIESEYQQMASEITRISNATSFNGIHLLNGHLSSSTHSGTGLDSVGKLKVHFGTGNDSAEDYYYVTIGDTTASALGVGNSAHSYIKEPKYVQEMDSNGDPVVNADGTPKYVQETDNAGNPVWEKEPTPKYVQETDNAGNPVVNADGTPKYVQEKDSNGDLVFNDDGVPEYEQEKDGNGDPVVNADGTPKYVQETDNAGNPIVDANGNPKYKQKTDGNGDLVWEKEPTPKYEQEKDSNGDLVFNDDGVPKYEQEKDPITGELVTRDVAVPSAAFTVSTQEAAQKALEGLTDAIRLKDQIRAHLGAMQNRLENTINNLTIESENLSAAESRISDADVSIEMTELTKNQIITQAAVAMLGQANSLPNMALSLIQGK